MAAVLRNTAFYTSKVTNKYLQDARDEGGRIVPIPFECIIESVSTVADTYNLCVLPANCKVVGLEVSFEAMGASAGSGVTFAFGDSGDADRYLVALDVDAVANGQLAYAGQGYEPTSDTIVVATNAGLAAVVGQNFKGCFFIVPGA